MFKWNRNSGKAKHRVFARLLLPYVIFLILTLFAGWIIYNKTIALVEKEVTDSHMSLLEQSKSILERRLDEISTITQQLAADTRIMQFQPVTNPFDGTNTFRILETNKSLYNYKLSNNFIYGYYVIFKNSELVLSPGGSSYPLNYFFDQEARYSSFDTASWRKLISERYHTRFYLPAQEVLMKGLPYTMLTYVQSLGYPGNPQGAIAVMIDNKEIQKLFGGIDVAKGSWAYIVNDQGQVISSISSSDQPLQVQLSSLKGSKGVVEQTVNSMPMMITYTKSDYNGWTYLVGQPTHLVLEKVRYIQKIMFSLTFGFLIVGLFIAYMLAYRSSKPLKNILNLILEKADGQTHPKIKDAFDLIGETVSGLISNNLMLKAEIGRQIPLLRAAYFERLLNGQFVSSSDTDAMLRHVGLDLAGMSYVVAIVHLRGFENGYSGELLEELYMKRAFTKEILQRTLEQDGFLVEVAEDRIAVLFCFDQEQTANYKTMVGRKLQEAGEQISLQEGWQPEFGVGSVCDSLISVSRSYEQAREALHIQRWQSLDGLIWFDELPADHNNYYFPHDVEIRLMNLAKAGEHAGVSELLDDIYRENFESRHLTLSVMQLFMYEMWGSVVKLLPQMELDGDRVFQRMSKLSGEIQTLEEMKKSYKSIRSAYQWICDSVNEHKKSQNVQLIESVKELLESHYMDEELCLDAAADRLRISKVYLSQFFKEQTGVNFSDYLETLRMNQAKALLQTTNLTVNEISGQVGYSSSNTFCRAFKRLHGISATAYKKSSVQL